MNFLEIAEFHAEIDKVFTLAVLVLDKVIPEPDDEKVITEGRVNQLINLHDNMARFLEKWRGR